MCHLILLMPIMGLPVFWLMPLGFALPIYAVIVVASGLLYLPVISAMRKQPQTGAESLIGARAKVISRSSLGEYTQYLVRSQGELWSASCSDMLSPGETVSVASVNGIRLVVKRSQPADVKRSAGKTNEQHCH